MLEQLSGYIKTFFEWLWSQANNIASGIIASIIVISSAEAYGLGQIFLRNRRIRKLWKFRRPLELRVISGSISNTSPFVQVPTTWPDANAASILIQKCRDLYPKARVVHSFSCDPDDLTSDIITVGGPIYNEATRELMLRIEKLVHFKPAGEANNEPYYSLIVQNDMYTPEYQEGKIYLDFGAIIRMRNPLSSHLNDSILIVGCETFGVLSSALVLAGDKIANSARKEIEKSLSMQNKITDFVAVLSCEPLRYTVGAVRFKKLYKIEEENDVSKSV